MPLNDASRARAPEPDTTVQPIKCPNMDHSGRPLNRCGNLMIPVARTCRAHAPPRADNCDRPHIPGSGEAADEAMISIVYPFHCGMRRRRRATLLMVPQFR
jgi:hypothetical protein